MSEACSLLVARASSKELFNLKRVGKRLSMRWIDQARQPLRYGRWL